MGEYAMLGTESIKIGTCENMYYLRYDQRHRVKPQHGSLDPCDRETQKSIRFRFPWPDEDGDAPGSFEDPFRKLALTMPPGTPDEFDHYSVQFIAKPEGYIVSLPCPEGPDALTNPKVGRNGFAGSAFLTQQRVWEGRLVGVMQCVCGAAYRLPTLLDAAPFLEAIQTKAENAIRTDNNEHAKWLTTVATRFREGYNADALAVPA